MRIRTVKPEFWRNRKLAELGREVHGFAARLLNAADDEGYFEADPALLAGDVLPFDNDAQRFIRKAMPELERIGFVEIRGGEHGIALVVKFREHQRINRPSKSRLRPRFEQLPGVVQLNEPSVSPHGALSESSLTEVEQGTGNREQGNGTGIVAEPAAPASMMPGPEDLAHAWNTDTTPPLPRVEFPLGKVRKKAFEEALTRRSLPVWRQVFQRINASAFCRGSSESGWLADVDWATRPEGKKPEPAGKVLEGTYDRGPPTGSAARAQSPRREEPESRPEGRVLL